jgi:hypothetical protein
MGRLLRLAVWLVCIGLSGCFPYAKEYLAGGGMTRGYVALRPYPYAYGYGSSAIYPRPYYRRW